MVLKNQKVSAKQKVGDVFVKRKIFKNLKVMMIYHNLIKIKLIGLGLLF